MDRPLRLITSSPVDLLARTIEALLLIDLDHFKDINDRYGHAAGDAALREVCARMSRQVRLGDLLARLSGFEFGAVMRHGAGDARENAQPLLHREFGGGDRLPLDEFHREVRLDVEIGGGDEPRHVRAGEARQNDQLRFEADDRRRIVAWRFAFHQFAENGHQRAVAGQEDGVRWLVHFAPTSRHIQPD